MVDAQHVVHGQICLDPLHPPGVAVFLHYIPPVQGVAPQLAVLGKSVRRTARHFGGKVVLVQLEQLRVCPHVGTVHSHINGGVSDDLHALFVGVFFQVAPLLEKQELSEHMVVHVLFVPLLPGFQSLRVTQPQILFPLWPGAPIHPLLNDHVKSVILHPGLVTLPESFQHTEVLEIGECPTEQLFLSRSDRVVVHVGGVLTPRGALAAAFLQQTRLAELLKIDKQRIARKSGVALIGAVTKTGGPQRKHLPIALLCPRQEVHPFPGRLSKGANTVFGWQTADGQEHSRSTGHPGFLCHIHAPFAGKGADLPAPDCFDSGPSIALLGGKSQDKFGEFF